MTAFVFGVFGLIVGSFLNVVIIRHGVHSIGGRSSCMTCGRILRWYDLVPVLSWLALRGRCRECKTAISPQYPLVEAATGILFAFVGWWVASVPLELSTVGISLIVIYLCIVALLICIAVYDLRHTIIPDEWAYAFAAFAFVSQFLTEIRPDFSWPFLLIAGPIAASPLFALWFFSRGTWMGFGDVKLALGIGWLLGPMVGIVAIFFAFVIGALVSVCILLPLPHITRALYTLGITSKQIRRGGFTMKSEIPFGPFLILSCIILWFITLYGIDPLQIFGLSL